MEVTPEMRKAVAAEAAAADRQYQREGAQRLAEWRNSREARLKDELREILPDLTDEDCGALYVTFSDFFFELNN
jgi:hypothetical protein